MYDYENRLIEVKDRDGSHTTLATYTYDALGHRVKQVRGSQTTRYYYDGETVLAEYDGSDHLLRYHVRGPTYVDEHILLHEQPQGSGQTGQPGQEYYYLLTHLYSVSGLVDTSGAVVERYRYDAYGAPTTFITPTTRNFLRFQSAFSGDQNCSDAGRAFDFNGDGQVNLADYQIFAAGSGASAGGLSPFRFTGQRLDFAICDSPSSPPGRPLLVLYHYRARACDAHHGRFLQRDPAEYTDSSNLYEHVNDTWKKLFDEHPELQKKAWDLLLDYTEDFDKAEGTSLFRALVNQVTRQFQTLISD